MPVLHAVLGLAVAHATGMSEGGAVVLGTLAASASYIAAPAAVRLALPDANPGLLPDLLAGDHLPLQHRPRHPALFGHGKLGLRVRGRRRG